MKKRDVGPHKPRDLEWGDEIPGIGTVLKVVSSRNGLDQLVTLRVAKDHVFEAVMRDDA